jgi:hypothetical protein
VVLSFGSAKEEDVLTLIAKKNYAKAIEVLKRGKADPRAKMQLADVLVMAGKSKEAVAVLAPLADEYAREGFAAKAVAVLKKIQKIDPSRHDVEQKLASLIQEKQRVATISLPTVSPRGGMPEIGIEEIGMEAGPELGMEAGPELGMDAGPAPSIAVAPPPSVTREPPSVVAPPPPSTLPMTPPAPTLAVEVDPLPLADPAPLPAEPLVLDVPPPAAPPAPVVVAAKPAFVDTDFFTDDDLQLGEPEDQFISAEPLVEAELVPEPAAAADPMSDSRFAEELMGLVDSIFEAPTSAAASASEPLAGGSGATQGAGQQIVVSPLFQHFSVDEMVAVIAGLNLLTFDRGDVIIRQGQPGNSLYMLTSGKVRAFVKKDGKNVPVADLNEGAFFGEGSILTGKPRSATVAALTACELLELDRPTLDDIASRHPHVMDVLREFAARRIK